MEKDRNAVGEFDWVPGRKWMWGGFDLEEYTSYPMPDHKMYSLRSICAWWSHPEIVLNALTRKALYELAERAGCVEVKGV